MRSLFGRGDREGYPVEYEHPTQGIASAFLRAIATDDARGIWDRLSRETRGLLEGLDAARSGQPLHAAAGLEDDETVRRVVAPLRSAAIAALGGAPRVNTMGVSAARLAESNTAFVLLLPDFGEERIVSENDWRPGHLLAFVHESREWRVDLGRTRALSAEAAVPDPLGSVR